MQSQRLDSLIPKISAIIGSEGVSTGQRAALRRMTPRQPPPLAFYSFAVNCLPDGWDRNNESRKDWVTIVGGIALMSPNSHDPKRGLGRALSESEYSEARLQRLLSDSATGDVLRFLVLRASRFLAAKLTPFDWVQGSALLLTRDQDRLDSIREQIAKDFYRAKRERERGD